MKNLLLGTCASGLLLASVGCIDSYTYVDQDLLNGGFLGSGANMQLQNGRLQGDFGPRGGFDGDATLMSGNNDREYQMTTVNVAREQDRVGAGMVILSVVGRTLDDLEPGEHRFVYSESGLDQQIYVNGCSGPDVRSFDYDLPADQGTVSVEQAPDGTRRIDIQAETTRVDPATGQPMVGSVETAEASFVYTPRT
jgi:hypothetical protein